MQHWTMSSINKKFAQWGTEPRIFRLQGESPTTDLLELVEDWWSNCHRYTFICMNSAIRAASRPHGLTEVTFIDLWPLLLENSGPTAHYFQRNSYLKLLWLFLIFQDFSIVKLKKSFLIFQVFSMITYTEKLRKFKKAIC